MNGITLVIKYYIRYKYIDQFYIENMLVLLLLRFRNYTMNLKYVGFLIVH